MPSIGGIDNSQTTDRSLEDVTTLITVDLGGPNSPSTLKSSVINNKPLKGVQYSTPVVAELLIKL